MHGLKCNGRLKCGGRTLYCGRWSWVKSSLPKQRKKRLFVPSPKMLCLTWNFNFTSQIFLWKFDLKNLATTNLLHLWKKNIYFWQKLYFTAAVWCNWDAYNLGKGQIGVLHDLNLGSAWRFGVVGLEWSINHQYIMIFLWRSSGVVLPTDSLLTSLYVHIIVFPNYSCIYVIAYLCVYLSFWNILTYT